MSDATRQRSDRFHLLRLPELAFQLAALGKVADRRGRPQPILGFQQAQADLYREFRAILVQSVQIESLAHSARFRLLEESSAMPGMPLPQSFRHQKFDRFSQQLFARITERPFG